MPLLVAGLWPLRHPARTLFTLIGARVLVRVMQWLALQVLSRRQAHCPWCHRVNAAAPRAPSLATMPRLPLGRTLQPPPIQALHDTQHHQPENIVHSQYGTRPRTRRILPVHLGTLPRSDDPRRAPVQKANAPRLQVWPLLPLSRAHRLRLILAQCFILARDQCHHKALPSPPR